MTEAALDTQDAIKAAAALIRSARHLTAFTGAGISVESGIPPFRGPGGLWGKYDPRTLEIEYFLRHPEQAWPVIREIFYDNFGRARPNKAHEVLAAWERDGWARGPGSSERGRQQVLITQNIDNLHSAADCFEKKETDLHRSQTVAPPRCPFFATDRPSLNLNTAPLASCFF
jgi:NAD-dependent deacetylase